jgi:hypothetical protein
MNKRRLGLLLVIGAFLMFCAVGIKGLDRGFAVNTTST